MTEAIIEIKSKELLQKIKTARPDLNIVGTSYYVSNEGDDNADGLSPETAWKTIERVNQSVNSYKRGDAVLFRSGDTFRGSIELCGITYSSYGEGEKPHLYASPFNAAEVDWKYEGDNIYSITWGRACPLEKLTRAELCDVGNIIFNHGKAGCGYKKWYRIGIDLEFDLDFYHCLEEGKIYLKSDKGAPGERFDSIELCPHFAVFHGLSPACDGATLDGLIIKYSGSYGVSICGGPARDILVKNCEFEWIGGSIMTPDLAVLFGNAFEIWGTGKDVLIENCYFNQTYDAAVTPQWHGVNGEKAPTENFVVRGCLFERNTYDLEYFITQRTSDTDRSHFPDTKVMFKNILFENNICRLNGYGFGSRRTDRTSAACIKGWKHQNKAENFVFRNNIFDRSDYLLIEACADKDEWLPTFENNVYCQYLKKGLYDRNGYVSFTHDMRNEKTIAIDEGGILIDAHRTLLDNNSF